MRILFFSHYFPPEGNAPAARTHAHARRWVEAGHDVTVVTCVPNHPNGVVYPGYRNRPFQRETLDGIEVLRVWTFPAANRGTVLRILNYVSYMASALICGLFIRRPDVILATSPQFFCGWAGALTALVRRRPFILEVRDLWPDSIEAVGAMRSPLLLRLLRWMEQRLYTRARHIVTVGEGYREGLIEKGVPPSKISVIMNGLDPELLEAAGPGGDLKAELGLGERFVCAYVGTIGMAAGLDVVLRAAERLRDEGDDSIAFLLVGDGANLPSLKEEAARRQLERVVFTGRVDRGDVPGYLRLADACLVHLRRHPVFRQVLPSKLFEAGGLGRPVILGVEGAAARWLEKSGGGEAIEPEHEEALIAAIRRLRDNPEERRRKGESGRAFVLRHATRDRLAWEYLNLIQSFVPQAASSAAQERAV